jgi:FKBP-type peptidyl-prolyl cis-trans isomerase FkpA
MKKQLLWLLALVGFSTIFSCTKSAPTDAEEDASIKAYIAKKGWSATATPEGVYYVTDVAGTGSTPALTNVITAYYKGYTLAEVVFDGNIGNGKPAFSALLGGGLIEGWKIGFQKFKSGGKGKLIIPSRYAYGTSGSGSIGANEILVFEIELVSFK